MTQTVPPQAPPTTAAQIGEPGGVLTDEQVRAFVLDQLAAADLDGRSVCVLVPDGTRSCPCRCCFRRCTRRWLAASRA